MSYSVKEIYHSIQGEGANTGRAAVFLRFAGCNLWSGREEDRDTATCRFCDTEFVGTDGPGGGKFQDAEALAAAVLDAWDGGGEDRFVVCTGGEPFLQLDSQLIDALHDQSFEVAVETNGTLAAPAGLDWICVSPKADADFVLQRGDELKVVFPQLGMDPAELDGLEFDRFFLQPMDGPDRDRNTELAIQYCLEHPKWELSLQTHKLLGLP
ncbi:MAG: 7-carboxy-7-deazaguanine synthase [Gemmatimonadetes bacterium]|nr:7-carboxy-7-deazaguanine synthase [Gemmatimonadota bacterium]